jgi:hypothetical protein
MYPADALRRLAILPLLMLLLVPGRTHVLLVCAIDMSLYDLGEFALLKNAYNYDHSHCT